jgi:methionyl aminopeptidase
VGAVDYASKKLIKTSYDSLFAAIATVRPGTLFRDFGNVITEVANKAGFSVVKAYCGHGIGSFFHCPPDIPHYERNKIAGTCQAGMVFTIEPMINAGSWKDDTWPDEWTSVTVDGKRSAQFEHTMLVTEDGVELLTGRTAESAKLWWELEENAADLARYEAEMKR